MQYFAAHGFGILQEDGTVMVVGLIQEVDDKGQPYQKRFSGSFDDEAAATRAGFRFERGLNTVGENVRIHSYSPPQEEPKKKEPQPAWMDMLPPDMKRG